MESRHFAPLFSVFTMVILTTPTESYGQIRSFLFQPNKADAAQAKESEPAESSAKSKSTNSKAPKKASNKAEKVEKKNLPKRTAPAKVQAQPQSPAPSPAPGSPSEIDVLRQEISVLKESLAAAGVIQTSAPTKPELSAESKAEKLRLENEISDKKSEMASYQRAIDGGLDPQLVKDNMDAVRAQIATLQAQLAAVEATAEEPPTPPPTMQDQVESQAAEIKRLKIELDEMKARQAAEEKTREDKMEKTDEDEKSFIEEIGELLPIELFAFGDFFYAYRETGDDGFEIGQLELDLSQDLGPHLTVSVGVAFDGESFGVGAFTIDGRLAGKEDGHLLHSETIETSGILFGQFDVPFGIEYLEYASVDNPLVTGPIAIEETHGAWNDLGGQLYLNADRFNGVFFVVNGFDYETIIPEEERDPDDEEMTIVHESKVALGARIGLKPAEIFEIGGSVAGAFASDIGLDMVLVGGDVSLEANGFSLKGEYLFHFLGVNSPASAGNHAIYTTAMYEFNRFFTVARYSMYFPEKDEPYFSLEHDPLKQLSAGFGIKVLENASVRVEYSSDLLSGGSLVFVQLVGGTAWQPTGLRR